MRIVLRPASAGITAITGIPDPPAGFRIRVISWLIMGTATGSVFLASNATPATANLLDSLFVVAGGGALQAAYSDTGLLVPQATGLFVVAAAGDLYGHLEYVVEAV